MSVEVWTPSVERFASHLEQTRRSAATGAGYVKHLMWLAEGVSSGPWELTSNELGTWLEERAWSRETRRKVLVSFRVFYAWAVAEALCQWAPTAGLPSAAPKKRGPHTRPLPPRWRGPFEDFSASLLAGGRSEGTVMQYMWRVRRLAEVAADPWAVTGQQLAQWLSTGDWAPETKRASRNAVRGFYKWAVKAGHIPTSPAEDLDPVRVPRALPRPAPADALRAALSKADDRTRIAVLLAAYAGLRRFEIAKLHTSEITATHLIIAGKGKVTTGSCPCTPISLPS